MKPYEKLKQLRLSRNITTYELSELTGIPQSTISKMENGKRKIEAESLQKLADALSVSVNDFFDEENAKREKTNIIKESNTMPEEFKTPQEAMQFILKQPAIFGFGGFDINKMSDEEILDFANELLRQLKLISYKYKK